MVDWINTTITAINFDCTQSYDMTSIFLTLSGNIP